MFPNYFDPFGGYNLNPTGGGAYYPGGATGAPGWLETVGDIVEDVGGILNILFPNRGTDGSTGGATGGGGYYPVPTAGVDQSLISGSFSSDEQKTAALQYVENNPTLKEKFISFLRAVKVAESYISSLLTASVLAWPGIFSDLLLLWLTRSQPFDASTTAGQTVDSQIPISLKGGSPTLPTVPGQPVFGIPELGQYAPTAMPAVASTVYRAPKGYVTVTHPTTGQKAFVLKAVAKAMGLYKPRKKAPISASDWDAAKKASRIETKLSNMLKGSCNFKVTRKR